MVKKHLQVTKLFPRNANKKPRPVQLSFIVWLSGVPSLQPLNRAVSSFALIKALACRHDKRPL
jgi:hypothetical protein